MKRLVGCLVGVLVVGLGLGSVCWAGGTLVLAPRDLDDASCAAGAATRFEGYDARAFVLGCVFPEPDRGVLLAGSRSGDDAFACFYVVPAGDANEGPCAQVRSTGKAFGGPLSEATTPVTGELGLTPLTIGRYGDDAYLAGWASDDVRSVVAHFSDPSGNAQEVPAGLLRVPDAERERLQASAPFSILVARIPDGADTCLGVEVTASGQSGTTYHERFRHSNCAYPSKLVPLPGSQACDSQPAMPTVTAVLQALFANLTASLLPSLTS